MMNNLMKLQEIKFNNDEKRLVKILQTKQQQKNYLIKKIQKIGKVFIYFKF